MSYFDEYYGEIKIEYYTVSADIPHNSPYCSRGASKSCNFCCEYLTGDIYLIDDATFSHLECTPGKLNALCLCHLCYRRIPHDNPERKFTMKKFIKKTTPHPPSTQYPL